MRIFVENKYSFLLYSRHHSSYDVLLGPKRRCVKAMSIEEIGVLTSNIFSNGAARRIELLVDVQRRLSSTTESLVCKTPESLGDLIETSRHRFVPKHVLDPKATTHAIRHRSIFVSFRKVVERIDIVRARVASALCQR